MVSWSEIKVKRSDNQPGTRTLGLERDDRAHLGKSLKLACRCVGNKDCELKYVIILKSQKPKEFSPKWDSTLLEILRQSAIPNKTEMETLRERLR